MKQLTPLMIALVPLLACGSEEGSGNAAASNAPAVDVTTEAEAAAQAAEAIDEDNYDEEYERLKAELESDTGN